MLPDDWWTRSADDNETGAAADVTTASDGVTTAEAEDEEESATHNEDVTAADDVMSRDGTERETVTRAGRRVRCPRRFHDD
jgi:hypothetical protein